MFGLDQGDDVSSGIYEPHGPRYQLRITGVVRMPQDIGVDETHSVGQSGYTNRNAMFLSNRFYEMNRNEFLDFGGSFNVQLQDGRRGAHGLAAALSTRTPSG